MSIKRLPLMGFMVIICLYWQPRVAFSREPGFSIAIHRVKNPPRIDGNLDDTAWKSASRVELIWTAADKSVSENVRTQAMSAYDETALYVAFLNRDPDTANLLSGVSEHDKNVPDDDSVSIFIEVGNTGKGYSFSISVNPTNTTYDTWMPPEELSQKIRNGEIPKELVPVAMAFPKGADWEPKGLKTATHIDKQSWTVEIKIPFEDLLQSGPPVGKVWGVNFVRHIPGWEDIWATWSKAGRAFFKPEKFGDLTFLE